MRYVAAGLVPMVSRVGQTIVAVSPPSARRRNASQAEYAGSIPVIGSMNQRFGGISHDCQRPSGMVLCPSLDRGAGRQHCEAVCRALRRVAGVVRVPHFTC
jgi:hypothetical protein